MLQVIFFILAAVSIFSALMTITKRNPMYSVLYLVLCFFSIAGHYVLLNAEFLAVVNVIVYAGAIMVLFLFVLMLLNLGSIKTMPRQTMSLFAAVIAGGILMVSIVAAVKQFAAEAPQVVEVMDIGTVKHLGKMLFNEFVLPFELSSLLFISAMIGAIILVKKDQTQST